MDKLARGLVITVFTLYAAVAAVVVLYANARVWGIVAALAITVKALFFHAIVRRATRLKGRPAVNPHPAPPTPHELLLGRRQPV